MSVVSVGVSSKEAISSKPHRDVGVADRVNFFARRDQVGESFGLGILTLVRYEIRNVLNVHDPVVGIPPDHIPTETKLDGAEFLPASARIMVVVPLQTHP